MQTVDFTLTGDYVALCDLLKLAGLAGIGYGIFKLVSRKLGEVDFNPFD